MLRVSVVLRPHPCRCGRFFIVAGVLLAVWAANERSAQAVNTGFLPGDACFGSRLTEKSLLQFDSVEPVTFAYQRGVGVGALCGYAGYWNLTVNGMSPEMMGNIKQVYWHLRHEHGVRFSISQDEDGIEHRYEINQFRILIYNRDYDVERGIGLKLNENWMNLVDFKRHTRASGAYEPYVSDYRAVARDWKRAPLVSGLAINEKDAKPWWGPRLDESVSIDANKVQILILPVGVSTAMAVGVHSSRDDSTEIRLDEQEYFYRITNDRVTRCYWNTGNDLIEEPWPVSRERQEAAVIQEVIDSLNQSSMDTLGMDDEAIPAQVREKLDELRDQIDVVVDELTVVADEMKSSASAEADSGE